MDIVAVDQGPDSAPPHLRRSDTLSRTRRFRLVETRRPSEFLDALAVAGGSAQDFLDAVARKDGGDADFDLQLDQGMAEIERMGGDAARDPIGGVDRQIGIS